MRRRRNPCIVAPVSDAQPNNPLHGVTLKAILETLVERHGWEGLAARISLRCFKDKPSIGSSLTFLRKTDWARSKVEQLYLDDLRLAERNKKRNQRRAAMRAHRAAQQTIAGVDVAPEGGGEATEDGSDATEDDARSDEA